MRGKCSGVENAAAWTKTAWKKPRGKKPRDQISISKILIQLWAKLDNRPYSPSAGYRNGQLTPITGRFGRLSELTEKFDNRPFWPVIGAAADGIFQSITVSSDNRPKWPVIGAAAAQCPDNRPKRPVIEFSRLSERSSTFR